MPTNEEHMNKLSAEINKLRGKMLDKGYVVNDGGGWELGGRYMTGEILKKDVRRYTAKIKNKLFPSGEIYRSYSYNGKPINGRVVIRDENIRSELEYFARVMGYGIE